MPDTPTVIVFENGDSEDLIVTTLGSDLYRVEENSFLGEVCYLDVIRAIAQEDGSLLLKEIVTPSHLATQSWALSKEIVASGELREILDRFNAAGGNCELAFGGILIVNAPKDSMEMIAGQINGLWKER